MGRGKVCVIGRDRENRRGKEGKGSPLYERNSKFEKCDITHINNFAKTRNVKKSAQQPLIEKHSYND